MMVGACNDPIPLEPAEGLAQHFGGDPAHSRAELAEAERPTEKHQDYQRRPFIADSIEYRPTGAIRGVDVRFHSYLEVLGTQRLS